MEAIEAASPDRRAEILAAALIGGSDQAVSEASRGVDEFETEKLLSDLFGE